MKLNTDKNFEMNCRQNARVLFDYVFDRFFKMLRLLPRDVDTKLLLHQTILMIRAEVLTTCPKGEFEQSKLVWNLFSGFGRINYAKIIDQAKVEAIAALIKKNRHLTQEMIIPKKIRSCKLWTAVIDFQLKTRYIENK